VSWGEVVVLSTGIVTWGVVAVFRGALKFAQDHRAREGRRAPEERFENLPDEDPRRVRLAKLIDEWQKAEMDLALSFDNTPSGELRNALRFRLDEVRETLKVLRDKRDNPAMGRES
jgi:hypothetical protein